MRIAEIFTPCWRSGARNSMVTSDFRPEVETWPFRACAMHPAIIIGTGRSLWTWLWDRYHVPQNVFLVFFFYFVHSAFHKLGLYVIPHTSGVIHQLERIFACMIYYVGQTIILTIPFRSSMRGLAYYLSGFAFNHAAESLCRPTGTYSI